MSLRRAARVVAAAGIAIVRHRPLKMSAALAYYAALSLAPMLLIILAVAGLAVDRSTAVGTVATEMERVLGRGVGDLVRSLVDEQRTQGTGVLATILGGVTILFGATGIFAELQDDLDLIWGIEAKPSRGILAFLRHRLLSLAVVAGIGFLLLVSFVVNGLLSTLAGPLERVTGQEKAIGAVIHSLVSVIGDTLFFSLIYKVLPDVRIPMRHVWPGALATAIFFVLGQFAIGEYLGRAAVGSAYGAAGSLVVMLVWVYYSALIVLFGAELTRRLAVERGYVPPTKGVPVGPNPAA